MKHNEHFLEYFLPLILFFNNFSNPSTTDNDNKMSS